MSEDVFALPSAVETKQPDNYIEESFPILDPDQVEKEQIEQFVDMQKNMPMQDVAAHVFKQYFPIYKQLLSGLSNKDAKRVAEHVVQWPLENAKPNFTELKAEQAFQIGTRLVDCKMIMRAWSEMETQRELEEKKQVEELLKQNATVVAEENKDGEQV